MSKSPLFSVLIAAYNQGHYLRATLDSVAAQTCNEYEVVIVNDGSTDNTDTVVREWVAHFGQTHANRIAYVVTSNQGQSAAFERGFSECRGGYVCLLDSDDRWLATKLACVADVVRRDSGAGMIGHPLYVIDSTGRRTGDIRPKGARISHGDIRAQMRRTGRHVAPATSGLVLRADVFRRLLPMATSGFRFGADGYLAFGASLLEPLHAMEEPLGEYRMHPGGQYLRRMLTADGLEDQFAFQQAVAGRFGLSATIADNAFYARNAFALAVFHGGLRKRMIAYSAVMRATVRDPFYPILLKLRFFALWTVAACLPRDKFAQLWAWFQKKQTGYDKVEVRVK